MRQQPTPRMLMLAQRSAHSHCTSWSPSSAHQGTLLAAVQSWPSCESIAKPLHFRLVSYYLLMVTSVNDDNFDTSTQNPNESLLQAADKPSRWKRRWTIIGLCFVAFMLCNMDRVNMSIAILPMAKQYGWDTATIGIVQSSFFW